MTRLTTGWIKSVQSELLAYDQKLQARIGMDLPGLSGFACGMGKNDLQGSIQHRVAAVIPVTSGLGVIGSFSQSVSGILNHLGLTSFVTARTDVDGISEAFEKGADILWMADDNRYIAFDVKSGKYSDNNDATALGFVSALEAMAGSLAHKSVLLLGYGTIGARAFGHLSKKGADITVYDKDPQKTSDAVKRGARALDNVAGLKDYLYIIDATNEGDWIHPGMLSDDAMIATPGVPLSLDDDARQKHEARLVHDVLQIGTAVMLASLFACSDAR